MRACHVERSGEILLVPHKDVSTALDMTPFQTASQTNFYQCQTLNESRYYTGL